MQPVMVEQHLDRMTELGLFGDVKAAVWEEFESTGGGIETRQKKKVGSSECIKKLYTVAKDCRIFVAFSGGSLQCLLGGDQIELNGTQKGHGTGLSFVLNSAPRHQPLRRVDTSFRAVDKLYPDMTTI